jgi:parvulin-like peptidyl-prolyl isomerase
MQKAREALPAAKTDFQEAVKKGDPGSAADAGHMPRGVLEPAVEYVLFTMAPDTVHEEPVDTPRGFWILRRLK